MKRNIRSLTLALCAALVLTLLPATALAAPPSTYYPVDVRNGTVSAATMQIYNGVPYVDTGDTVTVTAVLPSGLFTGGYDYSDQVFTYWVAQGVTLADATSSSAVFVMPGNAVTLGAHFKTAVSAAPAQIANPFRDFSATMEVFTDRIGVSYTPARNFTVNLIGKHDLSQYEGIGGDGGAADILRRVIEEYTDAVNVFDNLRNTGGITYLEDALRARDQYLIMPATGESVLLCEENWDRIVDEYFAISFGLDEDDIEELKNMQLFELTDHNARFYVEWLSSIWGDPSAAARDCDICIHDLTYYLADLYLSIKTGLPEDLLEKVKLERGSSFYYEAYYVDGGGSEVVLYRLGDDVDARSSFSKTGSAWLNLCQPAVVYQKDVAEQHGCDSPAALRTIADKVRVRFVTDEVLTDATNDPFVSTYTNVIVPVPSVLSVSGVTPGAIYTIADTATFYTETENLFEGEPGEGDLRLLPRSWSMDDAAPVAFAGAFGGTVDMSALIQGYHRLTVNFVYQAYTGGTWIDRDTVVPYDMSFTVTDTTPDRHSSDESDVTYYTITATAGEGGGISPSGSTSVTCGNDKSYTITASEGYEIADVLVDDASVGAVSTYTFENVKKAHTIAASFKKTETPKPFTDVSTDDWFYENVLYVFENSLMTGTGSDSFSPNSTLTRAMIVTVLHRLSGDAGTYTNVFTDVALGKWHENAVAWAAKIGIASGVGNNLFAPNADITREQLAVMLYNYAKYMGYDVSIGENTNILSYDDALTISDYAYSALQWACGTGIINGDGSGKLNPKSSVTRAELAAMLERFIKTSAPE